MELNVTTCELLTVLADTWGQPGYPVEWPRMPSQRRWEYEETLRMLNLPAGASVLDVGAGNGYMSYILSHAYDVLYNDLIDNYKQPDAPVQKIVGSFFTLPSTRKFDGIACVSVLEHVPPDKRVAWIKKLHDLLRPGGVVAMTFEWHPTEVYEFGDGSSVTDDSVNALVDSSPLTLTKRTASPVVCTNSRGWRPLALRLTREDD